MQHCIQCIGVLRIRLDSGGHWPISNVHKDPIYEMHYWVINKKYCAKIMLCGKCCITLCVQCFCKFHTVPDLVAIKDTIRAEYCWWQIYDYDCGQNQQTLKSNKIALFWAIQIMYKIQMCIQVVTWFTCLSYLFMTVLFILITTKLDSKWRKLAIFTHLWPPDFKNIKFD